MTYNLTLRIKRIFLSFIQAYFQTEVPPFIWNVDPRLTKIFIADKNAVSPAIIEKMPSIVVARTSMGWMSSSIDQRLWTNMAGDAKVRADLVRGNITFMCSSPNGIEAELLADTLFNLIPGWKDEFRKNGVHQIMQVTMGEEQIARGDADVRVITVPVTVGYGLQSFIKTWSDPYSILVVQTLGGLDIKLAQIIDYTVSGDTLTFKEAPIIGSVLTATYTGAYTLAEKTEVLTGVVDGVNKIFTVSEVPYANTTELGNMTYETLVSGLWDD